METIEMLQKAFVDEFMGKTQIKVRYKRSKSGRGNIDVSVLFNQIGTILKDATHRMMKIKSSGKKLR